MSCSNQGVSAGSLRPQPSGDGESMLSVVLPNFNHGVHLDRSLGALLAQERAPDEIIVIDDASTDDSLTILARYASAWPSVKILANALNQGALASLQQGLEAARGRYVYFAAADDWVMPGFFALGIEMLVANPQRGLFCAD